MIDRERKRWTVEVAVVPKTGVNDPQGDSIHGALAQLGYADVSNVRSGRFFRLTIEAADAGMAESTVGEMCERLLANPVIEAYRIAVVEHEVSKAAAP